jgi:hypothetical protein
MIIVNCCRCDKKLDESNKTPHVTYHFTCPCGQHNAVSVCSHEWVYSVWDSDSDNTLYLDRKCSMCGEEDQLDVEVQQDTLKTIWKESK